MTIASSRARTPESVGRSSQPPSIARTWSMSSRSVNGWSSANRRAMVDLPLPGAPFNRTRRVIPAPYARLGAGRSATDRQCNRLCAGGGGAGPPRGRGGTVRMFPNHGGLCAPTAWGKRRVFQPRWVFGVNRVGVRLLEGLWRAGDMDFSHCSRHMAVGPGLRAPTTTPAGEIRAGCRTGRERTPGGNRGSCCPIWPAGH